MINAKRISPLLVAALALAPVAYPADDRVAAKVAEVSAVSARGPFAPSWDSLAQFQTPPGTRTRSSASSSTGASTRCPPSATSGTRATCTRRATREFEHHVATYGPQATFGYKDFIPRFKAEKFDARRWASLFKAAGARYVVPVAEHHDGFPMYDCCVHRLERGEDGPEARRGRRAGRGGARRGPGLRRLLATAPSTGGSTARARSSTPTCATRASPGSTGPPRTADARRRG